MSAIPDKKSDSEDLSMILEIIKNGGLVQLGLRFVNHLADCTETYPELLKDSIFQLIA